jgi:putative DNA primase/helicase
VADCEFTFYRMAVKYEQAAPAPSLWLAYLADLLEPDDVQTFQEFLGYCMIPSTKAQKMLYMIGSGGEGKSLAGVILKALFGDCMTIGTLHELEARFGLADVEGKLLFLDDDLRTAGLTESANVKTLVTASTPVRIERKGVQAYQAKVACRLMAFGNQIPDTIYDQTNGAYRRRIILRTKEKPAGRVDDPNLADKIVKDELPGVFNWMLAGLQRLHANSYRFTIGEAAQRNLEESKLDAFSPAAFFADEDAVQLGDLTKSITSANLYAAYCQWCKDNCLLEVAKKSFFGYLSAQAGRLRIRYDKHLPDIDGRRVLRGYYGIELLFPVRRFEIIPDFIP